MLPGLVFGGAYLLKDRSGIARAIIWMDADADGHERFPARVVEAPSRASPFRREPADLDGRRVGAQPLADLLASSDTRAFLVLRGGALVYERYFGGAGQGGASPAAPSWRAATSGSTSSSTRPTTW
jgi:hypothetical protein